MVNIERSTRSDPGNGLAGMVTCRRPQAGILHGKHPLRPLSRRHQRGSFWQQDAYGKKPPQPPTNAPRTV